MKQRLLLLLLPLCLTATSCEVNINFFSNSSTTNSNTIVEETTIEESDWTTDEEDTTIVSSSKEETTAVEESTVKEEWSLVWGDDFEGTSLDTRYWNYQIGDGSNYGITGWGNQEEQYYKSENAIVSDGNLIIRAKRESQSGYNFTSARITTANKISCIYGKIEARIALPAEQGMWPAFWMLPEARYENQGWPHSGEIDIMEAKGRVPNATSGALHFSDSNNKHTYQTANNVFTLNTYTNITEFHTYGIIWTASEISWYCDDYTFLTVTRDTWHTASYSSSDSAPFNQSFHILLNMAVGGTFDNYVSPTESFTSADMTIDYVRVFKHND